MQYDADSPNKDVGLWHQVPSKERHFGKGMMRSVTQSKAKSSSKSSTRFKNKAKFAFRDRVSRGGCQSAPYPTSWMT
jgi:hypothetical protein